MSPSILPGVNSHPKKFPFYSLKLTFRPLKNGASSRLIVGTWWPMFRLQICCFQGGGYPNCQVKHPVFPKSKTAESPFPLWKTKGFNLGIQASSWNKMAQWLERHYVWKEMTHYNGLGRRKQWLKCASVIRKITKSHLALERKINQLWGWNLPTKMSRAHQLQASTSNKFPTNPLSTEMSPDVSHLHTFGGTTNSTTWIFGGREKMHRNM